MAGINQPGNTHVLAKPGRPARDRLARSPARDRLARSPACDRLARSLACDRLARSPACDRLARSLACDRLALQGRPHHSMVDGSGPVCTTMTWRPGHQPVMAWRPWTGHQRVCPARWEWSCFKRSTGTHVLRPSRSSKTGPRSTRGCPKVTKTYTNMSTDTNLFVLVHILMDLCSRHLHLSSPSFSTDCKDFLQKVSD